ncbi:type IV pilus secretin PilQ [Rhodoferax sp.]|uniref:type IV pilus secretin PilQ n=1 Tax=Rhodoferax sp. TaxID=50421 RepID=UPI0019DF64E1|nr:type IV pilus secretin PilQ [Rhodoferax sp.]MBE0473941.1 type IV pilus secretin PilQ [Rhodoferax sp.]
MKNRHIGWMGRWWQQLALGLSLLLTAAFAQAQVAIESVSGAVQSGVEVVKIDFSDALSTPPTGFTVQSPARIALDFPYVVSGIGRATTEVNQGNLRTVSVVQVGNRTRVVLNLKQATTYTTQWQGKSLLVLLDALAASAPAPAARMFAENQSRDVQPLRDLDFRRGDEGAGRVVVSLPSSQVGVDVRQQGQLLVVEFMKTSLPEGMRRRLDVNDFGTPIKTITTTQTGDRVRMEILPQGVWVHSAYQTDEQFVLEVKPVKVDPTKLTQGPGYSGQKLSLNFQSIEIRSLLQVIADFTNFNVITSDSVSGTVTLRLQDVPWDQALDIILQAKGLGVRKTGNVLWIAPKEEIIAKEKLELESKATVLSLEPVRTESFQLNYAKAVDVAAQLSATATGSGPAANTSRILSPRGSATAETRTNQLFVTDVPSKLEQVQNLITKLDIPVRQVLIEARIVEASDTFGRSLGVKLGGGITATPNGGPSPSVAIGSSYTDNIGGTTSGSFVNLPAVGLGDYNPATFALSIFSSAANRFLNLELSALEADGKGKVVSSPRVVTADQKEAVIEQGREVTLQSTFDGKPQTDKVKGVLSLKVTPRITPDGGIVMAVEITKNTIMSRSPVEISVKSVKTEILVENGGTVVIGGIFELSETVDETKVPLLGDIPGLGNLFKSRSRSTDKQEMLVFITPKLVADKAIR